MTLHSDMKFWIVSDRMEYPLLSPVDRLDIRACMEYCRLNELCNIFDYDPTATPPCWAKTKAQEVQRGSLFESETSYNFFFQQEKYEANLKTAACKCRRSMAFMYHVCISLIYFNCFLLSININLFKMKMGS